MQFLRWLVFVSLFTMASSIYSFGQNEIPENAVINDTLAISLINYLWEEDSCANKEIRKHIGFFVLKKQSAFIGKTQTEIKSIFGEPQLFGHPYNRKNEPIQDVISMGYITAGDACNGTLYYDYLVNFNFKENQLIEINMAAL